MRYTSAVEILRHMRSSYGEKPSISAVCRGISLSYQPTYFHIKELEKAGVIATSRVGRESLCLFVSSPAAALWLGMVCERDARAADGVGGALLSELRPHLRHDYNAVDFVVFVPSQGRIIACSKYPSADAATSLARRCSIIAPDVEFEFLGVDELMQYFETGPGQQCAREAIVISGHQQFWHYVLAAGEGMGIVRAATGEDVGQD